MAKKANKSLIAVRYAQALLSLAQAEGVADKLWSELKTIVSAAEQSEDLARLFTSPVVSKADQMTIVNELIAMGKLSNLASHFLAVLVESRRLSLLSRIVDSYHKLLSEARGEVVAEVSLAKSANAALLSSLQAVLDEGIQHSASLKSVRLSVKEDPQLIGGLVVKIGSQMIDASVRSRLERMQLAMKGV